MRREVQKPRGINRDLPRERDRGPRLRPRRDAEKAVLVGAGDPRRATVRLKGDRASHADRRTDTEQGPELARTHDPPQAAVSSRPLASQPH